MSGLPMARGPRHSGGGWRPIGVVLPGATGPTGAGLRDQFDLEARLGRPVIGRDRPGAVYRARHRASGLTVAMQVLANTDPDDPQRQAAFRGELESLTALDHPHIIAVVDAGLLEAAPVGDQSGPAQGPCLVLEHASGGALAEHPPADWPSLRATIQAVLDALAHAHARGVLHHDLTPSHLLWATEADLRPGLKVAGFGLVRLLERTGSTAAVGTPAYLAPEQFAPEGSAPEQFAGSPTARAALSPATDLYALGCVLYALGCGAPPFGEGDRAALGPLHRDAEPPPPAWRFAVPPGLSAWTLQLLAKRPADRFNCAAEAAAAFATVCAADATCHFTAPSSEQSSGAPPSLPASWRRSAHDQAQQLESRRALQHLCLGLLAVRPAPLIGRETERDRLWQALHTAQATGRPLVVLLTGAADLGLGRLARWLGERAAELGRVETGAVVPRCEQLRVSSVVGPAAVLAALRTIEEAVTLADGPQVILVSLATSALARTPRAAARLAPLTVAPTGERIELQPLSAAEHERAVRAMLDLAPATLAPLRQATDGYPGWARLWLSAWLAEGRLVATPAGFAHLGDPHVPPAAAVAPWRGLLDEALWFAGDRPDAEQAAAADAPEALPADVDTMLRRLGLLVGTGVETRWVHPGVRWAFQGRAADAGR